MKSPAALSFGFFLLLFGLVNVLSPSRFSYFDFSYLSSGGATLALAAIGQTLVVLSGGFDLSTGAAISLVNVVLATHLHDAAGSGAVWCITAIAIGGAIGAFNGVFVAFLRLQPIVVTLSTMFMVNGMALFVQDKPGGHVPAAFASFFTGSAIPNLLPAPIVTLAVVLGLWLALRRSRFGTSLYAVGGDAEAAASAGVHVARTRFATYVVAGMVYGLAGIMVTAQTGSGDPLVGRSLLLQVFAAVVIGGTRLGGGRGGSVGSVFGAYSLMLIVNILLVLNVSAYYSTIVEGAVLVLAALAGSVHGQMAWTWTRSGRGRRSRGAAAIRRAPIRLIDPASAITPVGWLDRHRELVRDALPAYICFALILLVTASIYGGLDLGYANSLLVLTAFLAVLALGQGAVILTGGLDLSVPWAIGLCGILLGGLTRGHNLAALWVVPFVLAVGAIIGVVNGVGVVLFGLPPIVITLAMNGVLQGAALIFSGGTPDAFAPPAIRWMMTSRVAGLTPVVWLLAALAAGATLLLGRTPFGRRVYAIGNSVRVARLSGVNVGATLVLVYVLSGVCSATLGILLDGFSGQASLGMGDEYLLPSIAVVVVGGALITGGRGHYLGMIGGALLLTALQTLLAGTTLPAAVREIIYGLVVLTAVVALRERARG